MELLADPNAFWVLSCSILLGITAGWLGCFTLLRKESLAGDALAHAALPGVTVAFALTHSNDRWALLFGALLSCFLAYGCLLLLIRGVRMKADSALAFVLSFFFALGIFHLTQIQKEPYSQQAGLDRMLFGQAAALVSEDVFVVGLMSLLVVFALVIFFQRFRMVSFDRSFCRSSGIGTSLYDLLFGVLLVTVVVIGLDLVGVVLMAALLITPAAAARYWTHHLPTMVTIASVFGAASGALGVAVSFYAPKMPTGPWIVVFATFFFAFSLLFAPERGMVTRILRRRYFQAKIREENLLRALFRCVEDSLPGPYTLHSLVQIRPNLANKLQPTISVLERKGELRVIEGASLELTARGIERAQRVTRYHRLWEHYLSQVVNVPQHMIHEGAENVEHLLTEEIESQLLSEVSEPSVDPHGKAIPRRSER